MRKDCPPVRKHNRLLEQARDGSACGGSATRAEAICELPIERAESMKITRGILIILVASMVLGGCVHSSYTKTVQVRKDAEGNIVSTLITESVTQPNQQGYPVKFEHLTGIQP